MHFGFSYVGLIYLVMLFAPNIKWARNKPKDYDRFAKNENKILLMFERTGEILTSAIVLVFSDFNIHGWNGQSDLSAVLNAVFSIWITNIEFRKAEPQKYRLLQAADFFCSMELIKIKREENRLSRTEEQFFYKPQELKKTFIKGISKKRFADRQWIK